MPGSLQVMQVRFQVVRLNKRYPLTISRGTSSGSSNLFVCISDGEFEGIGECAPGTGYDDTLAIEAEQKLRGFLETQSLLSPYQTWNLMKEAEVDPAAMAAVDIALWDLLAKKAGLPLYELLGLPQISVPTSVTIGINPTEVIRERVPEILERTGGRFLKIKLGSTDGIEADKASFLAAKAASAGFGVNLRVDANGGWNPKDARTMIDWLHTEGCDYVEQPLPVGMEEYLADIFACRKLPIFLDESIKTSHDIPQFADRCDGINLKLMKTGGITEAVRLVAAARSHSLDTMIGCMGESSVAIAAGASIGALFDHIDLDSHLNLQPDPAQGLAMTNGIVMPTGTAGHGASLK